MKKPKKRKAGKLVKKKTLSSRLQDRFSQKKPIAKFTLAFGLGILLFYSIYFSDFFTDHIAGHLINGQARFSSFLLNIFGFDTTAHETFLSDGSVFLDIRKGCDGIEPTTFFLIGVLLVPFSGRAKLVGLFGGLLVLSLLNILRIIGLFVVNTYWPEYFDFLHLHGGFTLFIIVTIVVWLLWANWAIGLPNTLSHDKNAA